MKISGITLTPIQTHRRTGSISSHLILQMHTDEGVTGLGEISDLDMYRMYMPDIEAVRMGIEKVVLGRDPFAIEAMHREMANYLHNYFASAPSYPPFTPGSQIAAGIDMACYDIMGKALDVPACDLFGGRVRDGIEICYPLFQVKAEADYERNLGYVQELLDQGISRFRYYVGVDFDKDEKFLTALRDRFGQRVILKALDFQARHYWKDVLRAYERLKPFGFEVIESSEQGMLAQVAKADGEGKPIVFLGWEPHPMNANFKMTYLSGGDDVFGPNFGGAEVYTNTRAGYSAKCPNVGKLLSNQHFTLAMENEIMGKILNDGEDPRDAAKEWLASHEEVLGPWLEGVTTKDGGDAMAAVKAALN